VSGGGKKPYKQKGTGRPQVGSSRTPLWRKGGTVFGPQPRSYEFDLPKKVRVGAVRAALAQKLTDGAVIVVDRLESEDGKTKGTAEMFRRLGVSGKALVIDVKPGEKFTQSARNIEGLHLVAASRVTARDIMDTAHVIATREAIEKLQETLA
jgi:large subunit ribosomal protein L4